MHPLYITMAEARIQVFCALLCTCILTCMYSSCIPYAPLMHSLCITLHLHLCYKARRQIELAGKASAAADTDLAANLEVIRAIMPEGSPHLQRRA